MSNIEWTEKTWNPVIGCTPVSPGCLNCYAATMANRMQHMPNAPEYAPREVSMTEQEIRSVRTAMFEATGTSELYDYEKLKTIRIAEVKNGRAVFTGDVRCLEDRLTDPLHWKKPRMIFVNSMSDLFHESVPFEFVDKVMAVAAMCPQHTFQILTKRPERMRKYFETLASAGSDSDIFDHLWHAGGSLVGGAAMNAISNTEWPLPNVWLGVSVENQKCADERIPHLLATPAAVRFLSCEPLLSAIDLRRWMGGECDCGRIEHGRCHMECPSKVKKQELHWVIVGGESGPNSRPCDVAWIRSIVQQCQAASVPVFVKQLGARPCMNYYAWARWCEERAWDFDDARLETPHGAEWDIERDGQPRRDVLAHFPNRKDDRKGSEMSEWPEDLRVREMPQAKC